MKPIGILKKIKAILAENGPERCSKRLLNGVGTPPERVLCLGKAAPGLAEAAKSAFPGVGGLVYGTAERAVPASFTALWGDHPLPTSRNLDNTARVIKWLKESLGRLLVCVSGGTSALIVEPAGDWTLSSKRELTEKLLASGASIREINTVRARLSRVKAGGLLTRVAESDVVTAIWSDVGPHDSALTGSGPTIPWSGRESAEEILSRHSIVPPVPLPPRRPSASEVKTRWFVLFDAIRLRRLIAAKFRGSGLKVIEMDVPEGITAEDLAEKTVAKAKGVRGSCLLVGAGEATVPGGDLFGCGGRCSHLAAEVALKMLETGESGEWAFVAVATDGVDGSAGGGAFTGSDSVPFRERLSAAIAARDTGTLWREAGTLIPRSPTNNNLRDAWVFFKGAGRS